MRFTKKPITVEAYQIPRPALDDVLRHGEAHAATVLLAAAPEWLRAAVQAGKAELRVMAYDLNHQAGAAVRVMTPQGWLGTSSGDWIIQGVEGELYPCSASVFAATYDPEAVALPADAIDARPSAASVLDMMNRARAELLAFREADGKRVTRDNSVALTELETAILWMERDLRAALASDFRGRMVLELAEVGERLEKLQPFLLSAKFAELPEAQRAKLTEQAEAMAKYVRVLRERLELLA